MGQSPSIHGIKSHRHSHQQCRTFRALCPAVGLRSGYILAYLGSQHGRHNKYTRFFLLLLLKTEGGLKTIVNLRTASAHTLIAGGSSYRTSKLAILRWTEFLNVDYGAQGLLAYCVHPGGVMTELASAMPKVTHASE